MKLKEYFGDRDINFGDEPKRFIAPWVAEPPFTRYKIAIGHASIVTDKNRISAEALQTMSEMPAVSLIAAVSHIHITCADQSGKRYVYRVLCDGVLLDTIHALSHADYAVTIGGTYQVGVSIDGGPEILSETIRMEVLEMPPGANLPY